MRSKPQHSGRAARPTRAFTLIELIVVMGIIILLAALVLPTAAGMFTAGTDSQAYNLISAQLTAARAMAIQRQQISFVHIQPAASVGAGAKGASYIAIYTYYPPTGQTPGGYRVADGYSAQRLPGTMTAGAITSSTVDANGNFTMMPSQCVTIAFRPDGSLAVGWTPTFPADDAMFTSTDPAHPTNVWDTTNATAASVSAITLFDGAKVSKMAATDQITYLNQNAQFIPVNVYTGQLFPRKP